MSNSLDPDQARRFDGVDLSQNCLQRFSVEETSTWVKVQNFQNPELSKLALYPLNIFNFKFKWSIVLSKTVNKSEKLL